MLTLLQTNSYPNPACLARRAALVRNRVPQTTDYFRHGELKAPLTFRDGPLAEKTEQQHQERPAGNRCRGLHDAARGAKAEHVRQPPRLLPAARCRRRGERREPAHTPAPALARRRDAEVPRRAVGLHSPPPDNKRRGAPNRRLRFTTSAAAADALSGAGIAVAPPLPLPSELAWLTSARAPVRWPFGGCFACSLVSANNTTQSKIRLMYGGRRRPRTALRFLFDCFH
ncbi:hypothetical protein HPB51_013723 [Rhipicephalus microplus]|uniref:Uncharacterized protein n=1 Tax=Rhipicephalus microplus TaxID=6941 RepID=A0A9J6F3G7_RHIMP|nr:hypothetical protein HPB51_013723 [Rhipicephalus microplus]